MLASQNQLFARKSYFIQNVLLLESLVFETFFGVITDLPNYRVKISGSHDMYQQYILRYIPLQQEFCICNK